MDWDFCNRSLHGAGGFAGPSRPNAGCIPGRCCPMDGRGRAGGFGCWFAADFNLAGCAPADPLKERLRLGVLRPEQDAPGQGPQMAPGPRGLHFRRRRASETARYLAGLGKRQFSPPPILRAAACPDLRSKTDDARRYQRREVATPQAARIRSAHAHAGCELAFHPAWFGGWANPSPFLNDLLFGFVGSHRLTMPDSAAASVGRLRHAAASLTTATLHGAR